MNLEWVDPAGMSEDVFTRLCEGCAVGGYARLDVAKRLLSGKWMAFSFDGGVCAVEVLGTRMYLRACRADKLGWRLRRFHDLLYALAADLACDTVETTCFNPRLAKAMMRIRATPEAWVMVWQVEGNSSRGQQEND